MFYIVRLSFLYITGGFSHVYSSRLICLSNQPPPCSLVAEIGFGATVMTGRAGEERGWSN